MKKLMALLLALTLVMGLVACGNNSNETTDPVETTPAATGDEAVTPEEGDIEIPLTPNTPAATNGASDILTNIWSKIPEANLFPVYGGSQEYHAEQTEKDENYQIPSTPAVVDVKYTDTLSFTLLVPADQIANIDEAASVIHFMNGNNFTAGLFHVTGDVAAFAEAMHTAISNNPWMCGMPEKLIIAVIEGEYVLACFGINDAVGPFETALGTAYANAEIKYNEAITG